MPTKKMNTLETENCGHYRAFIAFDMQCYKSTLVKGSSSLCAKFPLPSRETSLHLAAESSVTLGMNIDKLSIKTCQAFSVTSSGQFAISQHI